MCGKDTPVHSQKCTADLLGVISETTTSMPPLSRDSGLQREKYPTSEDGKTQRERQHRRDREKRKEKRRKHQEKRRERKGKSDEVKAEGRRLRYDDSFGGDELFLRLMTETAEREREKLLEMERMVEKMNSATTIQVPLTHTTAAPETFLCKSSITGTCETSYQCMISTSEDNGLHYDCLSEDLLVHNLCFATQDESRLQTFCCRGNMCNDVPPLTLPPLPSTTTATVQQDGSFVLPVLIGAIPAVFIILIVLLAIFIYNQCTDRLRRNRRDPKKTYIDNISTQPLTECDSSIELPDPTSGSGSGMTMLVPRTVAKCVTLVDEIGCGKYGSVWKGEYQGSPVAVKIFLSKDVTSWEREHQIYAHLLKHENILGFLAADMASRSSVTQFWLITHYHELGSLYDYLNRSYTAVTPQMCMVMLQSAASGLVHLHTEICGASVNRTVGTEAKPAIAHRDIKSKNILVRNDGTCCIADFGLAVTHKGGEIDLGANNKVGTKRYMAPEILSEQMSDKDFESFKRADVYAFSLVMWETAMCSIRHGFAGVYQMPYGGMVPSDPSFEDMKQVVVCQQRRPCMPTIWKEDKAFNMLSKVISECWSAEPKARLTMLRVKKSLNNIYEEIKDDKKNFL